MSESSEIAECRRSDSNLTRGRSSNSTSGAAVQAASSTLPADGKPSDSALTADGKTADGNAPKSRQDPSRGADKIKVTLRLNPEIVMELKLFCALKKRRLAEVVESAVSDFCSRQPHGYDDLDDDGLEQDQHHQVIRRLYERLTGNAWRDSDSKTLQRIPMTIPLEVIEMAMLMARLRAKTPIRSLAYFVPEILNPDYARVKTQDHYLRYLWRKFEAKQREE